MNNNTNVDSGIIKFSLSEILFLLFAGSLLFVKGMGFYEGQWPFDCMVIVAYLAYILKIVTSKHSIPELIITILFTVMGLWIYHTSGELGALFHLTFIVGMFGIETRRVWKGAFYIWILTFIVQLFTSFIGINPNNIYRIHQKVGTYIVRWSLGYTHPNVLHISYIVLIMLIFYIKDFKGRDLFRASIIALLGSVTVFVWSFSYTGMLISVVYIVLNLVFSYIDLDNKAVRTVVYLITPASVFFSVLGPVVIKRKAFELIDKALSTRFTLSNYYLTTQPITWWGTNDFDLADTSIVLDCSYVYALMHYGIVFFVMMALGLSVVVIRLLHDHKRKELAIAIGIVISGITEPFLANTSYKNIAFIFISEYLYQHVSKNKKIGLNIFENIRRKTIAANCSSWHGIKNRIKDILKSRKWAIIIIVCLMIVIGVLGYRLVVQYPDSLYSLLWKADRKPSINGDPYSEYCYLDMNNLPKGFNSWILSYTDEATPLYQYQGFTLFFEYLRRAIGVGVVCAFIAVVIYVLSQLRNYNSKR